MHLLKSKENQCINLHNKYNFPIRIKYQDYQDNNNSEKSDINIFKKILEKLNWAFKMWQNNLKLYIELGKVIFRSVSLDLRVVIAASA